MKKISERERLLLNALHLRGQVTVAEAVDLLGISEATVRRIFSELEKAGKVIRNYGGIKLPITLDSYSFDRYKKVMEAEKRRIGVLAASMVADGDSIYMDCGTTLLTMAGALNERISAGEVGGLNIITNSIANLDALTDATGCRVILLGGEYNHERRDFSGLVAEKCMGMFHFKKCFLGCEGWAAENGFSSNHLSLSSMNSKAIEHSERAFVLMDRTKFSGEALVSYAKTEEIDVVITDAQPEIAAMEPLEAAGIELKVAPGV